MVCISKLIVKLRKLGNTRRVVCKMRVNSESGTIAVCVNREYRAKVNVKRSYRVLYETTLQIQQFLSDMNSFVMSQVHCVTNN